MSGFQTAMQATVRVPQDGFTVDDLRSHMRAQKIPLDTPLIPTTVRDVTPGHTPTDGEGNAVEPRAEIAFLAEWVQE